jgi:hypothetical protein
VAAGYPSQFNRKFRISLLPGCAEAVQDCGNICPKGDSVLKKFIARLGLLLAVVFAGTSIALADEQRCRDYAAEAVDQFRENQRLECGFTGDRWSSNRTGHFEWCVDNPESFSESESRGRHDQLQTCREERTGNANEQRCNEYADAAVAANRENTSLSCGFTGARWSNVRSGHFQWCMANPENASRSEATGRRSQLQACRDDQAGNANEDRCNRYADEAVASNRENISQSCGLSGARWSSNRTVHFQWCMNNAESASRSEANGRRTELQACRDDNTNGGGDADQVRCRNYADEAVALNRENNNLDCGFTGPRWNASRSGHYQWCLDNSESAARAEAKGRRNQMQSCRDENAGGGDSGGDQAGNCREFVDRSLLQARKSVQLGCGFVGPRWSTDRQIHRQFCATKPESSQRSEIVKRDQLLRTCAANPGKVQICRTYATKAVIQAKRNISQQCDFTGRDWLPSYEAQFSWCMVNGKSARIAKLLAREAALQQCN